MRGVERVGKNYCPHFKNGFIACFDRHCDRCALADRMRLSSAVNNKDILLFTERDALRQTPKGGGETWYKKYIIVSPAALEKHGITVNLYNQIAYAYDGSGCFIKNPCGYVDCILFSDMRVRFTICRHEAFGLPNPRAIERFDELFFMNLKSKINGKECGAYDFCIACP